MAELFPAIGSATATPAELEAAAREARAAGEAHVDVLTFSHGPGLQPWFSFDVGERRFAIWRATGELFEADENGAVGDDPLPRPALRPDALREFAEWLVGLDAKDDGLAAAERRGVTLDAIIARAAEALAADSGGTE